jgi:hypothetical protein
MNIGMSREDRHIDAIAKALVKVLERIEDCPHDPSQVFDVARIISHSGKQGVRDAVIALQQHYCAEAKA